MLKKLSRQKINRFLYFPTFCIIYFFSIIRRIKLKRKKWFNPYLTDKEFARLNLYLNYFKNGEKTIFNKLLSYRTFDIKLSNTKRQLFPSYQLGNYILSHYIYSDLRTPEEIELGNPLEIDISNINLFSFKSEEDSIKLSISYMQACFEYIKKGQWNYIPNVLYFGVVVDWDGYMINNYKCIICFNVLTKKNQQVAMISNNEITRENQIKNKEGERFFSCTPFWKQATKLFAEDICLTILEELDKELPSEKKKDGKEKEETG